MHQGFYVESNTRGAYVFGDSLIQNIYLISPHHEYSKKCFRYSKIGSFSFWSVYTIERLFLSDNFLGKQL